MSTIFESIQFMSRRLFGKLVPSWIGFISIFYKNTIISRNSNIRHPCMQHASDTHVACFCTNNNNKNTNNLLFNPTFKSIDPNNVRVGCVVTNTMMTTSHLIELCAVSTYGYQWFPRMATSSVSPFSAGESALSSLHVVID